MLGGLEVDLRGGIAVVALLSAPASIAGDTTPAKATCGVVVTFPKGWSRSTVPAETAGSCEVLLAPPDWDRTRRDETEWELPPYAIRIRATKGGVDAACAQFGLCQREGRWYFSGKGGAPLLVAERVTAGARFFSGSQEERLYDRSGYRGLGVRPYAVIIGASRIAAVEPSVGFDDEDIFNAIVASIRLR